MKKAYWYNVDDVDELIIKKKGEAVDISTVIDNIELCEISSRPPCTDRFVTVWKDTPRFSNIEKAYQYMVQLVNLYCGVYAEEYHQFDKLNNGWHVRDDNRYGIRKTANNRWSAYRLGGEEDIWLQDSKKLSDLIDIYGAVK